MSNLKSRNSRNGNTDTVSISRAESNTQHLHFILSKVQKLSSSYGLHPFSVIPIAANDNRLPQKIRKWQKARDVPAQSFLLVLAIRSVFSHEYLESFVRNPRISHKISRSLLAAYIGNIKNSINGVDSDGKRWAAKQADLALQVIALSAKELQLNAEILKTDALAIFDTNLSPDEPGLRAYAIVSIV